MGCWNGTCLVTNLPIPLNESVKLIFILSQQSQSGSVGMGFGYSEEWWRPVGCPIDGIYNDYGYIKKIVQNKAYDTVLSKLRSMYGDVNFEKFIHEGLLDPFNGQELSFCMVPTEIYNGIVASVSDYEDYVFANGETKKKSIKQIIADDITDRKTRYDSLDHAIRELVESFGSSLDNAMPSYWKTVPLEEVVDFEIFCRAMNFLRTPWRPPFGLGSQHNGYDLYIARAKLEQDYCHRQIKNTNRET